MLGALLGAFYLFFLMEVQLVSGPLLSVSCPSWKELLCFTEHLPLPPWHSVSPWPRNDGVGWTHTALETDETRQANGTVSATACHFLIPHLEQALVDLCPHWAESSISREKLLISEGETAEFKGPNSRSTSPTPTGPTDHSLQTARDPWMGLQFASLHCLKLFICPQRKPKYLCTKRLHILTVYIVFSWNARLLFPEVIKVHRYCGLKGYDIFSFD